MIRSIHDHGLAEIIHKETYKFELELVAMYAYNNEDISHIIYTDRDFDTPVRILLGRVETEGLKPVAGTAYRYAVPRFFQRVEVVNKNRGVYRCIKYEKIPEAVKKLCLNRLKAIIYEKTYSDILRFLAKEWDDMLLSKIVEHIEVDEKFRKLCKNHLKRAKHLLTVARYGSDFEDLEGKPVIGFIIGVYKSYSEAKEATSSISNVVKELCELRKEDAREPVRGKVTAGFRKVGDQWLMVSLLCSSILRSSIQGRGSTAQRILRDYISPVEYILRKDKYVTKLYEVSR
jgi:hypothetical protein